MTRDPLPPIVLVQMEVAPGRPDRNVARMLERIERHRADAEVIVFSEMCVPGYLIGDAWEVDALVADFAGWSDEVRKASAGGLTVLFGNVAVEPELRGEDGRPRKYNAVYVCHDGEFARRAGLPVELPHGVHPKTLHPNYRFFDDDRHFYSLRKVAAEQGRPIDDWMAPYEVPRRDGGGTFRFGVQICEDMWCGDYFWNGEMLDTLSMWRARGAEAVFNLSASPWTLEKNDKRHRTVREILSASPLPFFYVNQVGAQNNGKNVLVFDGDTTAYAPSGRVQRRLAPWEEGALRIETGAAVPGPEPHPSRNEAILGALTTGLRHLDEVRGSATRYLVGVSGGIDSSLVTALLARVLGPERILAVNMPTRFNSAITRDNARLLCERLGVEYLVCPIEDLYQQVAAIVRGAEFAGDAGNYTRLVDENVQARIRGADVLAGLAAKFGAVFTNNGNKSETALGYATLYGDVNGAIAPLGDLYKTDVFALARHLNEEVFGAEILPVNLYDGSTVPSAELSEEQDVTRGLGDPIRYDYHDAVLRQMIEYRHHLIDFIEWMEEGTFLKRCGWNEPERFLEYFSRAEEWLRDLEWIERQLRVNYFKRVQAPPIIVVSKRAFGFDLRESQAPEYRPRRYAALRARIAELDLKAMVASEGRVAARAGVGD